MSLYAGMLATHGESDQAVTVLKTYFDRDATDQQADLMLAWFQVTNNLPDAIATLRLRRPTCAFNHCVARSAPMPPIGIKTNSHSALPEEHKTTASRTMVPLNSFGTRCGR